MSNLNLNSVTSLDTGREVDVNRVMQTVDYVGGLVIDSLDTVIVDGDDRYVLAASAVLPYTATGSGMPEGGAFVGLDENLRQDLANPDVGASAIGFKQKGVGAVSRSAQEKFEERVSVKDFGAIGDGVTDDTQAIQQAFDYAYLGSTNEYNGGSVYFPKGMYKVSSPVVLSRRGVRVHGDGRGSIIFIDRSVWPDNSGIFYSTFDNRAYSYTTNAVIEGLYFYAYDPSDNTVFADDNYAPVEGCSAIRMTGLTGSGGPCAIRDCFFKGFENAIAARAVWAVTISNNVFIGKKGIGSFINFRHDSVPESSQGMGYAINGVSILNNWFNGADWGIRTGDQSVQSLVVRNNAFEQINRGVNTVQANGPVISDNYFEGVDNPLFLGSSLGNEAGAVYGLQYQGNFLDATCGGSRVFTIRDSSLKNNTFLSSVSEFSFYTDANDWWKNTELEYSNSLGAAANKLVNYRRNGCTIYEKGSGNPAGIIERGSNSDGDYVRYSDGTQICTVRRTVVTSGNRNNFFGTTSGVVYGASSGLYSWPVPFAENPRISVTAVDEGNGATEGVAVLGVRQSNSSSFMINVLHRDLDKTVTYDVIAVGKWF